MAGQRALISVADKVGLVELARGLVELDIQLIASGGTARTLAAATLPVTEVSQLTGFPEILDGRVKTLHPAVHAGILARRTPEHLAELAAHDLAPIDLVVCNLYPFAQTVAQPGVTEAVAVEQIDIGGLTLLRAAAKNFESVLVVCDPADYQQVLAALAGATASVSLRRQLALKAFQHTAAYDSAIATYLARSAGTPAGGEAPEKGLPPTISLAYQRAQPLRYGENPHQPAGLYQPVGVPQAFQQLGGKEMSYNNWLDMDAAWALAKEFADPTVCIIKHTNPCGVASAASLAEAYPLALASDPVSAFGGIIAANRTADLALAEAVAGLFAEVFIAPGYAEDALVRLRSKANLRLLQPVADLPATLSLRTIRGGLLAQAPDAQLEPAASWQVVTRRAPTATELESLDFAWRVAKHVKSNAIVFAQGRATVGVGAGQMSRIDSVHLAARRAGPRSQGAVMASDAFFPFADGVEAAAAAGITAVVQPGGSMRDEEVIAACDRLGLAMAFTGARHFRH
jgi:phosphoribosylaminoimidazolecarboxamide formyltransferase/IMP cyclohydrolase